PPGPVRGAGGGRPPAGTAAGRDVAGALLEDLSTPLLGQPPPGLGPRDRDEGGPSRSRPPQVLLSGSEGLLFALERVTHEPGDAAQDPSPAWDGWPRIPP